MGRFVVEKISYTTVSTYHLLDPETAAKTKAKTKGLLCQMLSFSKDWNYSEVGLTKINHKDGRTSIRTCLKELEENGYLERYQQKDSNGKVGKAIYTIYEKPKHLIKDVQFEKVDGSGSNIFKVVKVKNYKSLPNTPLRDENLSLSAKGIICQIFSFSEDYDLTMEKLQRLNSDGKDAIRTAVKELIAAGYINKKGRERLPNGTFGEMIYEVYDSPHLKEESYQQDINKSYQQNVDNFDFAQNSEDFENGSESQFQPTADFRTTAENGSKSQLQPNADFPTTVYPTTVYPTADTAHNKLINNQINNKLIINQSINQSCKEIDRLTDKYNAVRQYLERNLEYECLISQEDVEAVDQIINLIADVIVYQEADIKINGSYLPSELVKSKFMKLKCSDIQYVIFAMQRNKAKVYNIRSYLIAALFNAPTTKSCYYTAEVNHDLYGGE